MRQHTHFYVMTLQQPLGRGDLATFTSSNPITPPAGATRADIYNAIFERAVRLHPQLDRAAVIFFSLEPNTL